MGEVDNYKFAIVTKINDHLVWWDPPSRDLHTIWFWVERERLDGPTSKSSRGAQKPHSPLGE